MTKRQVKKGAVTMSIRLYEHNQKAYEAALQITVGADV